MTRRANYWRSVLLVGATLALAGCAGPIEDAAPSTPSASAAPSTPSRNTKPSEGCREPTITVSSANELHAALEAAVPGTSIFLAPGVYKGNFVITAHGTKGEPIALCGTADSILDGGRTSKGYVLHFDGASYWLVDGFTVRNGQKGVVADETTNSTISHLTVTGIGDEAIHLRRFSTDNTVVANVISDTGMRKPKYGEGIYIGTAESNWCDISDCEPDSSDRNLVTKNLISRTTAESVDIKEGTAGGVLSDNTFDGSAIAGADSWVDVKGNGWLIEGNSGTNSPGDGYQTHEIIDGWGTDNVFRNNSARLNGPGFGYSITPALDNAVECSNTASDAGEGTSNIDCTTH